MLRKKTRSIRKDHYQMGHLPIYDSGSESESFLQSDVTGHNLKSSSFYSVPGLLVGLSSKGLTDSDSVRSPTSPLEFRVFSNPGQSLKSPRSSQDGQQRSWGNSKVGLGIIESLHDDTKISGKVSQSSESKNILFGPQLRMKRLNGVSSNNSFELPKSLPKSYAIFLHSKTKSPLQKGSSDVRFEIGESPFEAESHGTIRSCSLDSCRTFSGLPSHRTFSRNFLLGKVSTEAGSPSHRSRNSNQFLGSKLSRDNGSVGSQDGIIGPLSASEIEQSEDYTCVISHGLNPKTTRIYGDCILETQCNELSFFNKKNDKENAMPKPITNSSDFLSFCYYCNRKLEEEKDIYIYRFASQTHIIALDFFEIISHNFGVEPLIVHLHAPQ